MLAALAAYPQLQLLWVYIESRSVNLRTVYTAVTRHAALQHISPECFVYKQPGFLILRGRLRNFDLLQQIEKYCSVACAFNVFGLRRIRHFRVYCLPPRKGAYEYVEYTNTKLADDWIYKLGGQCGIWLLRVVSRKSVA